MVRNAFRSGLCGVGSLLLVNISATFTGVSLGFSWLSCVTAWALGGPGVVCLLLMRSLVLIG